MAKRFRFPLERVLSVRRMEERLQKLAFAQSQMRLLEAENAKALCERQHASACTDLASLRKRSPLPLLECLQTESFLDDLKGSISRRIKDIETRRVEMEKARQEFLVASTRRKAIEKIRAIRKEAHLKDWRTQEAKRFDEIASIRAQRQMEES